MAQDAQKLVVWMFPDEKGNQHPAVIIGETVHAGRSYALAVTDLPGITVLEKSGDTLKPVRDRAVVDALSAALREVMKDAAEPVLVFDAVGADGKRARFSAARMVAHGGEGFLAARDARGAAAVFRVPPSGGALPELVKDEALATAVNAVAAAPAENGPERVVLTFPDGKQRALTLVHRVKLGSRAYAVAADEAGGDAYVLREEAEARWVPVTDAREVERVKALMDGRA